MLPGNGSAGLHFEYLEAWASALLMVISTLCGNPMPPNTSLHTACENARA